MIDSANDYRQDTMNKAEWAEGINLTEELIAPGRANRSGTPMRPTKITIHNTDNRGRGADAHAHSRFVRETGWYEHNGKRILVSWHYTVDDRIAIRQLPDFERGMHAGSGEGNAYSLGVEICMQAGIDQEAANLRAAQLTALLLVEHDIPVDGVVQHRHWSGKPCPSLLMDEMKWAAFLATVRACVNALCTKWEDFPGEAPLPEPFIFRGAMCWDEQ